ncbi:hypothetical protein TNCV_3072761 [Trichonephila clavipes]|nr:hypothetical protein TNCV_3072761 [Trichonephila clavipes]
MQQFCLLSVAIQPEVRFIAKQNSLMKIGNNGNLVWGHSTNLRLFDDRLMNCQTKLRINHLTAIKSVAILENGTGEVVLEVRRLQKTDISSYQQKGIGAPQLSRQVAGRNYPPTNKNTFIRALTEEWDKLPQQLLDNVVQSMVRRVECCITLHGGHIPY